MRAVNLLPDARRSRPRASGGGSSSYVLLGVLGALLVGVVVYVLALNQVSAQRGELARLTAETRAAEARTAALGAFGDFAAVKRTRLASVSALAEARFDWERLVREIAHLLPAGTWLTDLEATSTPQATGATAPAAAASGTASTGPSLNLSACAPDQRVVAVALVRLRRLHGAEEVKLAESKRGSSESGQGVSSAGTADSAAGDCGRTGTRPNYKIDVTIAFAPQARPEQVQGEDRRIPARLGGGE